MSGEPVDADLRALFDLHCSRVLHLRQKCLNKLFERHNISPETTDPEELDTICWEGWPYYGDGPLSQFPKSGADFNALVDDGTEPPLPKEERLKLFVEIEATLQQRATLDTDPLTLPCDFKQLCALTNKLTGAALPQSDSQIPEAFHGLHTPLWGLRNPDPSGLLHSEIGLWLLDYEETVVLPMGGIEAAIGGGCWLCWCKNEDENWAWTWVTRVGHEYEPEIYEDVKDLLGRYCERYLNVLGYAYGHDIGEGVF